MSELKEVAKRVFLETLTLIDPESVLLRRVLLDGDTLVTGGERIRLADYREVVLIGIGKASVKMCVAVERLLGERITRGVIATGHDPKLPLRSEVIVGGHPLPDAGSFAAGERILELVQSCGKGSLILFLISGGGSALVELPVSPSISLEDLRATNRLLVNSGAAISEINTVRKVLSQIKGGRLGRQARGSQLIGLYVSDVNPGDLRSIASNPLLPEEVSVDAARDVLDRYKLMERLPAAVSAAIQMPGPARLQTDDKPIVTSLLMDNSDAVHTAAACAKQAGFFVEVDLDSAEGEYRGVADRLIDRLLVIRSRHPQEPVCVISGGEVSCPVSGKGLGGRNQEFVLYCAARLAESGILEGVAVLSCGTDGIDGNSKAAGAVGDGQQVILASRLGLDAHAFIRNNDSYSFFEKMGGLVVTGPTGNNVRDLRILVANAHKTQVDGDVHEWRITS